MGQKAGISAVVYVVVLILLLAFSVVTIPKYLQIDNFKTHKIGKTIAISSDFDQLIQDRMSALSALAENKTVVYKLLSTELEANALVSQYLLTNAAQITKASEVYVMNSEGTVVGCSVDDENKTLAGNNYSFREYFTQAMNGNSVIYPAFGVTTLKRGLYLSKPVISKETQKPFGVVIIKIGVEQFEESLKGFNGYVSLVSPEGVIFSSNEKDWLFKTVKKLDKITADKLNASRQFNDKDLEPLKYDITGSEVSINNKIYNIEKTVTEIHGWSIIACFNKAEKYPLTPIQNKIVIWSLIIESILLITGLLLFINISKRKEIEKKIIDDAKSVN